MAPELLTMTEEENFVRLVVLVPQGIKERLEGLVSQGYSMSGYVRAVLEREFEKEDQEKQAKTDI